MTLGLVMIVRDEAHCIARTLESVRPFVDSWTIVDTGSTDDTPELVRACMSGLPGALHSAPFEDFATTRNLALDLAGLSATHALMLDADDVLVNGASLRFLLSIAGGTCFALRQVWPGGSLVVPRIVRTDAGWRYRGRVHEVLTHPTEASTALVGPELHHFPSERGTEKSRARWVRDVDVLLEMITEDPSDSRAVFYLAMTLAALGRSDEARVTFERRLLMGGNAAELEHAALSLH